MATWSRDPPRLPCLRPRARPLLCVSASPDCPLAGTKPPKPILGPTASASPWCLTMRTAAHTSRPRLLAGFSPRLSYGSRQPPCSDATPSAHQPLYAPRTLRPPGRFNAPGNATPTRPPGHSQRPAVSLPPTTSTPAQCPQPNANHAKTPLRPPGHTPSSDPQPTHRPPSTPSPQGEPRHDLPMQTRASRRAPSQHLPRTCRPRSRRQPPSRPNMQRDDHGCDDSTDISALPPQIRHS